MLKHIGTQTEKIVSHLNRAVYKYSKSIIICKLGRLPPTACYIMLLYRFENKKELHALRGKFGPLWSQKLKVVIH